MFKRSSNGSNNCIFVKPLNSVFGVTYSLPFVRNTTVHQFGQKTQCTSKLFLKSPLSIRFQNSTTACLLSNEMRWSFNFGQLDIRRFALEKEIRKKQSRSTTLELLTVNVNYDIYKSLTKKPFHQIIIYINLLKKFKDIGTL